MNAVNPPTGGPNSGGTNILAVLALIFGILAPFTCITAPVGLVLGIIALVQIGRNPGMRGYGMALAGLVISCVGVVMVPVLAAILFPVFARARSTAQESVCITNIKHVGTAMKVYETDWNNCFPPAGNWNMCLSAHVKSPMVFICPTDESGVPGYAMNGRINGVPESIVVDARSTIMFFECEPGDNKVGGPELLPSKPRHPRGNAVCTVDGYARIVQPSQMGSLNWDPAKPPSPAK